LRPHSASAAGKGGDNGPAIEPGKSAESLLIQAVTGAEGVAAMPPKGQPALSPDEITLLKAWIDQGAKAPVEGAAAGPVKGADHWAFRPVVRPSLPEVVNQTWVRNPID